MISDKISLEFELSLLKTSQVLAQVSTENNVYKIGAHPEVWVSTYFYVGG